jgi:hypothetical protein
VAYAYNPRYLGGSDLEAHGLKPARKNSLWESISKITTVEAAQEERMLGPWVQTQCCQ